MKKILASLVIILPSAIFVFSVFAQHRGPHRGVPPFVTACASLNEGDSCTFVNREGTSITGTCTKKTNPRTNQSELICWNADAMRRMGPPPGQRQ